MVDFYHVLTLKCPICRTVQKKPLAISPDRSKTSTAWHGCNFQQQNRDSTSKKCDFIPPSVRVLGTRWGGTKFDPKSAPFVYFQPRGSSFWQPKMDGLKHKKMTRPPIVSYRVDIYVFRKKQTNYFWWYSQVWPNPFRSFSGLKFRLPRSIFLRSLHVWRNPARLIVLDHNMCVYDIKTTYSNVICLWFTSSAAQGGGRSFKDRTL